MPSESSSTYLYVSHHSLHWGLSTIDRDNCWTAGSVIFRLGRRKTASLNLSKDISTLVSFSSDKLRIGGGGVENLEEVEVLSEEAGAGKGVNSFLSSCARPLRCFV